VAACDQTYVLKIQRVALGAVGGFQVRIAMQDDLQLDFVPAYLTAFAGVLPLKQAHRQAAEAEGERDALLAWLVAHTRTGPS
jgi:hypothetical protein